MTKDQFNKKIATFRANLDARGETIQEFCKRNELDYDATLSVLRGRAKGKRGQTHRVFVALGLKPAPSASV
jgi:gp16 family phage-associated protein